MASDGATNASDGEYAQSGGNAEVEAEEEPQLRVVARKKTRRRAPSGGLRPVTVKRRAALLLAGGAKRRRREFLLWRERCVVERRQAREAAARLSNVLARTDSLVPVFLEVDLANNEIVVHL